MRVTYISDTEYDNLTKGRTYKVIEITESAFSWKAEPERILIENDEGVQEWFDFMPYNVIIFAIVFENEFVVYDSIGEHDGISCDKLYQLCGRKDVSYYYFVDDHNKFVGIPKYYFSDSTLVKKILRKNAIDNLLKEP